VKGMGGESLSARRHSVRSRYPALFNWGQGVGRPVGQSLSAHRGRWPVWEHTLYRNSIREALTTSKRWKRVPMREYERAVVFPAYRKF